MVTRVLVVGAVAAGMSAAHQALRVARARGRALQVVVAEAGHDTSYSACGIPYWVAGDVASDADLVARTAAKHRAAGIDLRLGTSVVEIDLDTRVAHTRGDAGAREVGFDELVLATGSRARVPGWALADDGRPVPGVRPVKTLTDGRAWVEDLAAAEQRPLRAVVVGGGYIGIEMAEAFLRRGLRVTLLTRGEVMGTIETELGRRVHHAMEGAGVEVICAAEVDGLECGAGGRVACVSAGSDQVPADVVAIGIGVEPETGVAREAGLPLGDAGGLLPDARQQVADGVWAAGDCVESVTRIGGRRVHVALGTHANKQGRVAGENLAGGDARFGGVLGTAITRFQHGTHHVEVGRTGPTRTQVDAAADTSGWDPVALTTESTTASGYMPEAWPVAVHVIADRTSRRLLGVQIVGGPGSAKRVDTAAVALWAGLTVDDVAGADLSYAPPFSPVHDPVQIACRRLADRM